MIHYIEVTGVITTMVLWAKKSWKIKMPIKWQQPESISRYYVLLKIFSIHFKGKKECRFI